MRDISNELLALTEGYCNGTLRADEFARLERLLIEDESARAFFRRYLGLDAALRDHGEASGLRLHKPTETAVPPASVTRPAARAWSRRSRFGMAAVLVLGVMAVAAVVFNNRGRASANPVGTLEQVRGDVQIVAGDGQPRPPRADGEIRAGDTVRTAGSESSTVVAYPDGTRLTLVGDTSVTCGDARAGSVDVHEGTLAALVAPRPDGSSMVFATPSARMQVLGTRFLIRSTPARTDLSVSEGRVRLTRISDGQAVDVPNGKFAVASNESQLLVQDIPALPVDWEADFEDGLQGWDVGERVTKGLPDGSRGGIKPVQQPPSEGETQFLARSNDGWVNGLFAVRKTSHVHVTFKIERPAWVNVFVCARTSDPKDPSFSGNYMLDDFPKTASGVWQTVTIPLSALKRIHAGSESLDELVPYRLSFTTPSPDCGLVIDRVWITADGPGKIESKLIQ